MALSRLRLPLLSLSPSLLRARLLSTSSSSRYLGLNGLFGNGTWSLTSISNLGMFPVDHFCAIINPPQAGILAVGRGNKVIEAVVGTDGIEKPAVVTKMNLTLSADHRVYDGKISGEFLSDLQANFRDIRKLLL